MSRLKDLTGQKFGRLTVIKCLGRRGHNTYWLCQCDCGKVTEVSCSHLTRGKSKSCGCLRKELTIKRETTHGKKNTRLYRIWQNMKNRCNNVNVNNYERYGKRGIKVCDEWLHDFMAFYNWSMSNGYKEYLTIDRIDVNGNYEPSNCRWVDYKTQNRNKRNVKQFTINGETHCLSEWCELLGLKRDLAYNRLRLGWTIEKALELEVKNER